MLNSRASRSFTLAKSSILLFKLLYLCIAPFTVISAVHALLLDFVIVFLLVVVYIFLFHSNQLFLVLVLLASIQLLVSILGCVNRRWRVWGVDVERLVSSLLAPWHGWLARIDSDHVFVVLVSAVVFLSVITVLLIAATIGRPSYHAYFQASKSTILVLRRQIDFDLPQILHGVDLWQASLCRPTNWLRLASIVARPTN